MKKHKTVKQKQDLKLTVAQTMSSLFQNSGLKKTGKLRGHLGIT